MIATSEGCVAKEPSVIRIALLLIAAHAIVDFALQPDWLVRRKGRFPFLVLHSAVHAVLTYLILQNWACLRAILEGRFQPGLDISRDEWDLTHFLVSHIFD